MPRRVILTFPLLAPVKSMPAYLSMSVRRVGRKSPWSGQTDANGPKQTSEPRNDAFRKVDPENFYGAIFSTAFMWGW